MTNVIVYIIDICIVMFLVGIFNIVVFDAPAAILLLPLAIIAVIIVIWAVRKIQLWDWHDKMISDTEKSQEREKSMKR